MKIGKETLLPILHTLLIRCWRDGTIPQDMRNATISTLYKNKGDRGDCNNYRGISLLSITGKLFARVILKRLQKVGERIYPESQCGFRAKRSTIDMVFSIRQLQEKCREQQKPLYIAFVDLTKAFDTVSRSGLYKILEKIGCPPKFFKSDRSFSRQYVKHRKFRRRNIRAIRKTQRCETGMCPCGYYLLHSLLSAFVLRI